MVDPDAPTPPYRQVAAILAERIRSGDLVAGRRVPSEKTLQQEYGIARGTARKVVAVLRDQGMVYTVPGRGTYVGTEPE